MLKWVVELGQFDLEYMPRTAIKGHALADFLLEFDSEVNDKALVVHPSHTEEVLEEFPHPWWILHVDGAVNNGGAGAGIVLISLEGHHLISAIHFKFYATNKDAEYEELINGLKITLEMGVRNLIAKSNLDLVVNQVNEGFQARGPRTELYLRCAQRLIGKFKEVRLECVPREKNSNVDALEKMGSQQEAMLLGSIPLEIQEVPSIPEIEVMQVDEAPRETWMMPILAYIHKGTLPEDKFKARCVDEDERNYILREVHEGICGNHSGGNSLAIKVLRQGYYWPTMKEDSREFPTLLMPMVSPWPFAMWGIDLIGELPKAKGDVKFGIPYKLVSDNGKQFDSKELRQLCEDLKIKKEFAAVYYPQSNGQTEAINKIIKHTLKTKLEEHKGNWPKELPKVLWSYNTTPRSTTGEYPFMLTYRYEAMVPVEVGSGSFRRDYYKEEDAEVN
ncbi:uncharacterized protein LOC141673209 [Apium graveolens]|uniref:uncharacterized protein LOC141673209 n=1 Tax=Apium graveolens TaxID=4045 RepID=UPI003D7B5AE8